MTQAARKQRIISDSGKSLGFSMRTKKKKKTKKKKEESIKNERGRQQNLIQRHNAMFVQFHERAEIECGQRP